MKISKERIEEHYDWYISYLNEIELNINEELDELFNSTIELYLSKNFDYDDFDINFAIYNLLKNRADNYKSKLNNNNFKYKNNNKNIFFKG